MGTEIDQGEWSDAENREFLMRVHLGLNPIHDLMECVRILHDEGIEAFERVRGPRCEWAHQWKPTRERHRMSKSDEIAAWNRKNGPPSPTAKEDSRG